MEKRLSDYRFVIIFLSIVAECVCFCEYGYSKVVVDIDEKRYETHINGNRTVITLDKSDEPIYEHADTTENGIWFVGTVTLPEVDTRNLPAIAYIMDTLISENDSMYSEKDMYYSLSFGSSEKGKKILNSLGKLSNNPIWLYIIVPKIDDYIEESSKNKYIGYFLYKDRLIFIHNKPDNGIELNYTGEDREFTLYRSTIPRFFDYFESFFIVNGNKGFRLRDIDDRSY